MDDNRNYLGWLTLAICCVMLYFTVSVWQNIKALREENQALTERLNALDADPDASNLIEDIFDGLLQMGEEFETAENVETPKSNTRKIISVSSKYKLEDRYTERAIPVPDCLGTEEGVIVVKIQVSYSGSVTKTSIGAGTTITDEDVLEAARRAALKTDFNFQTSAPNSQSGTITFTYYANN